MEIEYFEKLLKNNNAIQINEELIIFNDFELYNLKTLKEKKYKTLENLLEKNEEIKELIIKTKEFYLNGGRGSNSSNSKGRNIFTPGGDRGRPPKGEKLLNAELNLKIASGNNVQDVLNRFVEKYGNAQREYAIAVDENGYTYKHIKGAKKSVPISGDKGQILIHNHPNGSNFSYADLANVATTQAKGIIATSSDTNIKGTYSFSKNNNFKAKEFIKGLNNAKSYGNQSYNEAIHTWLKRNQKKYGYKYSKSNSTKLKSM